MAKTARGGDVNSASTVPQVRAVASLDEFRECIQQQTPCVYNQGPLFPFQALFDEAWLREHAGQSTVSFRRSPTGKFVDPSEGLINIATSLSSKRIPLREFLDQQQSQTMLSGTDTYVYTNYKYAVIALLCWAIYYMFWGLAIVCDDYFVASLEEICDALGLSADVAGATFMAAGSSAPELFTSLMGVFAVKSDVGVGTIVGSAVFNLCCIIGGTAVFTPGVPKIDWKPITRDTIFYAISIAAMIYVRTSHHL